MNASSIYFLEIRVLSLFIIHSNCLVFAFILILHSDCDATHFPATLIKHLDIPLFQAGLPGMESLHR